MIHSNESTGRAMKNRNAFRTERKLARALRHRTEWRVLPAVFLATLLALPVNAAVTIPTDPLASGVRVAPNVLFILDDSGSMARDYMPDNVPATTTPDVSDFAYTRNSLSYNPAVDYQPWMDASGNRLSGGTSYTSAYSADQAVPYTGVKDDGSTGVITSSSATDLSADPRYFYVPKDTTQTADTYLKVGTNYYRYEIVAGGSDIKRGVWGDIVVEHDRGVDGNYPDSGTADSSVVKNYTHSVVAGRRLEIQIQNRTSGSGTRNLNYWIYNPSGTQIASGTVTEGNSNYETIEPAVAGKYRIDLQRANSNNISFRIYADSYGADNRCSGETGNDGDKGWIDCVSALPNTSRDLAAELTNYATWYSYFRTRNKTAKAGAAEAFNSTSMGNKVRVGFTTIWDTNPFYIPVGDGNDGRFVNNDGTNGNPVTKSRAKWYSHLFKAGGGSTTPLQKALNRAGQYYSDSYSGKTGADGPYGPEAGTDTLSCRQNFTILTTDGYWNDSTVDVGTYGDANPGSLITNGLPTTDTNYKSFTYTAAAPYKASASPTLADIAMKYWKTDLMTLDNNVPSSYPSNAKGDDPAFWQHMVTFGISIGLAGTSGWGSVAAVPDNATWNDPTDTEDSDRIDDLLHAAVNGRGSFVAATNPQQFADGLAAALSKINERTAAFSNAGASDSTQLNSGTLIFTASYVSGKWSGLLRAEKAVDGTVAWNTSTTTGTFPAYGSRNIITRSGTLTGGVGAGGVGGGTTFPSSTQQAVLARSGGPANYAVTASDNADYIRGQQVKEGSNSGQLRVRSTVMGDIVNSSPAYVADSNTVFIGANDGMLHAFNATSGAEQFAYIPNIINFGKLAELSRGDYEHRWFVDGPIAISPLALGPGGDKNILVGTLGRGGRGVYALDVTTPAAFTSADVKWEVASTSATTANDNMGMVLGAPVLGKVRDGATPIPAVVLGNGINSGSDKAALLVLDMVDGRVIREIPTDGTTGNGLFAPTGIYGADGKTLVYAYAGDLQGNVWKFDLTSTSASAWSAKKIFHAEKTSGTPQSITGGIASAVDTRTNKRWVFFGTGSYLTTADGNDASTGSQSMYGVMDDGGSYTRSDLAARTVSDPDTERYFQDLTSAMLGAKHGWYVDLSDKGERIVQSAQMDGSFLVTASMMPSGNSCADADGSGYINAITPFPDMIANGKSYFDLDGDGKTDDTGTSDHATGSVRTSGMPTLPLLLPGQLRYQTSKGSGGQLKKGKPQWNRVSWRELRND